MNDNPWIDCEKELPPCDGLYLGCINPDMESAQYWQDDLLFYDGIGFMLNDIYRPVKYWKYCLSKRYGKIKD